MKAITILTTFYSLLVVGKGTGKEVQRGFWLDAMYVKPDKVRVAATIPDGSYLALTLGSKSMNLKDMLVFQAIGE